MFLKNTKIFLIIFLEIIFKLIYYKRLTDNCLFTLHQIDKQ